MTDYLYGVPGTWTLAECRGCKSLQLWPAPAPADIPGFYQNYFTHSAPAAASSSRRQALAARIRNAFASSALLDKFFRAIVRTLLPRTAQTLARSYAFLGSTSTKLRILDFGCGGGDLIRRLGSLGHDTIGLDFDEKALEACRAIGQNVYRAEDLPNLEAESFDVVTCMNVIEHVPDPEGLLKSLKSLLRPSGMLLIETPNSQSWLALRLGAAWRGLEVPRHLNVFSQQGLNSLVHRCGLVVRKSHFVPCAGFMLRSSNLSSAKKNWLRLVAPLVDLGEWMRPSRREVCFLELTLASSRS